MKLQPLNAILLALLLTSLAAEWLLLRPKGALVGQPLFPGLGLEQVASVELSGPLGELRIQRGPQGFVLPELGDYPALESALRAPIEGLARLTDLDRAGSGNDPAPYGLEAGRVLRLCARDGSGTSLVEVELGQPVGQGPGSAGAGVFVRVVGAPEIYAAPWLMPISSAARAFWDGRLLRLEPSNVSAVSLSGMHLEQILDLELVRSGAGFMSSAGIAVPLPAAEGLLLALAGLYLDDFSLVAPETADLEVALTLNVTSADGTQQQLHFGPFDPAGPKAPVQVQMGHWPARWRGELSAQSMLDWMGPGNSPLNKVLLHTQPR
jgi:hypothetical protein